MELSSIRRCFITYRESNANTDFPTLYSSLHFNQRTRMWCDTIWCLLPPPKFRFNPRTRMGCDTAKVGELLPVYWFQSTHPYGVRLCRGWIMRLAGRFQSTHPHGVRQNENCKYFLYVCFNPRTHMGCDDFLFPGNFVRHVSIHAPAWGATEEWHSVINAHKFQSTHPHGVRPS